MIEIPYDNVYESKPEPESCIHCINGSMCENEACECVLYKQDACGDYENYGN